jgi:dephospho-CoA kinase
VSSWPGKYVIGLTGNIATGKSVVRRMLEHLGAYTIDADTLSHRALSRGAPGYQRTVEAFGKFILDATGEIDRAKLGRIVFRDPDALKQLESIVHPLVEHAVDLMIRRASQPVIVVEAIKLIEGKLGARCDAIWVTYSPEAVQKTRLMHKRSMSEAEAIQRIRAQPPQAEKTTWANLVIQNAGSFEDTWKQVVAGWKSILPTPGTASITRDKPAAGELVVQRGRPRDSARIAEFITHLSGGVHPLSPDDVMAAFGDKAYLLLMVDKQLVGLAGWQVENLVARITELYLDPHITLPRAFKILITEVERASQDLQCEASLLFLPVHMAAQEAVWTELGYTRRTPQTLAVRAWQDAALESQQPDTILLFKQLRQDRVLRPI